MMLQPRRPHRQRQSAHAARFHATAAAARLRRATGGSAATSTPRGSGRNRRTAAPGAAMASRRAAAAGASRRCHPGASSASKPSVFGIEHIMGAAKLAIRGHRAGLGGHVRNVASPNRWTATGAPCPASRCSRTATAWASKTRGAFLVEEPHQQLGRLHRAARPVQALRPCRAGHWRVPSSRLPRRRECPPR